MAKLTKEEILHIAKLAKLELTEAELEKYSNEFNSILEYVSSIQEVDVTGIDEEHHLKDFQGSVLQEDVVRPSLPTDKVLQNATDGRRKGSFVKTSKIVSKEE
jgi:aspartyl-tRNA(Asn)/glutamyl-tRNA(Gln) amidotransferase subunit C